MSQHARFFAPEEPRIKTRARGVLRQILCSIIFTGVALNVYEWSSDIQPTAAFFPNALVAAIIFLFAIPLGLVVWLIFRTLRFAIGPALLSRLPHR
jgi:hypothetical protein